MERLQWMPWKTGKKANRECKKNREILGVVQILLGLLFMMALGTVYSYSVFRPAVEAHYGVGSTWSGLPYMAALASYALGMMGTGRVMDRFSPRALLLLGSFMVASGWLLSSLTTHILTLTLTYGVFMGSGVGIAYGVPMAVAAQWFPKRQGLMVGAVLVGFGLSPLGMAPLVRFLLEGKGLPGTFRLLGLGFAVLLPLLALPMRYPREGRIQEAAAEWRVKAREKITASRGFWLLYATFVLGSMVGLLTVGMTYPMAMEWAGMSAREASMAISFFALLNGAGRPVFGGMADRRGFQKTMGMSFGLMFFAATILLLAGPGKPVVFLLGFGLLWMNLGAWLAMAPVATRKLFGTERYSENYGKVFTAYGVGAMLGVLGSGVVQDFFNGPSAVFFLIGGIALAGGFLSQRSFESSTHMEVEKESA